jgi:PTH1 family peptidyl-tRNA hydrolase
MKLIVGLGNPGRGYIHSRHNIGFSVVTALSKEYRITLKKGLGAYALSGKGIIEAQEVILAEPLTFMNLSGIAVRALLKKHTLSAEHLLVVCDDLDLEFGRIKIRNSGSSGGQRGLESIIDALGTREFSRLRIGIGRPPGVQDAAEYVLSAFTAQEAETLQDIIEESKHCVRLWVRDGITTTMNIFNTMKKKEK